MRMGRALWDSSVDTPAFTRTSYQNMAVHWRSFTPYRWVVKHRPRVGHIRFWVWRGPSVERSGAVETPTGIKTGDTSAPRLILDSGIIHDNSLKGGKIGLYIHSQVGGNLKKKKKLRMAFRETGMSLPFIFIFFFSRRT